LLAGAGDGVEVVGVAHWKLRARDVLRDGLKGRVVPVCPGRLGSTSARHSSIRAMIRSHLEWVVVNVVMGGACAFVLEDHLHPAERGPSGRISDHSALLIRANGLIGSRQGVW
jgi:hypothetical protein